MKLALNGATTMKACLATDIQAASAAGFDCLEIWAAKLKRFLSTSSIADLRRLFDEHGLKPYSINSIEHVTFRDAVGHDELLKECEELCRLALEINCPYVVVVPSPVKQNSGLRTQDSGLRTQDREFLPKGPWFGTECSDFCVLCPAFQYS